MCMHLVPWAAEMESARQEPGTVRMDTTVNDVQVLHKHIFL